jgi:hypothetical protein
MKKLIIFLIILFSRISTIQADENISYIKNIDFFPQAPLESRENWKINAISCEEATILLYSSFLQ